jgi:hypothetical protein
VPIRARPLPRDPGFITLKERVPSVAATGLMLPIKGSWTRQAEAGADLYDFRINLGYQVSLGIEQIARRMAAVLTAGQE